MQLARRSVLAPEDWARLRRRLLSLRPAGSPLIPRPADQGGGHFLPTRAAAAAAASPPRPDGAKSMHQADPGPLEGLVVGSKSSLEEATRRTPPPARWRAIATNRRLLARPWRGPARRPDAPARGHRSQAVRSANSPPMSPSDARHSRYHRIAFWHRPPRPAKASARHFAGLRSNSQAKSDDRTCHIKCEYGQREERGITRVQQKWRPVSCASNDGVKKIQIRLHRGLWTQARCPLRPKLRCPASR
jgi:hypothetical protein